MMVFGAVWALTPNLDLALAPVRWLVARIGRLRHVLRVALSIRRGSASAPASA